jgi:hypothetical protein
VQIGEVAVSTGVNIPNASLLRTARASRGAGHGPNSRMPQMSTPIRGVTISRGALPSMFVMLMLFPAVLPAQAVSLRRSVVPPAVSSLVADSGHTTAHVIRWYEALATAGAVSTTFLVDEPLQRYLQRHRSNTSDDVATAFRHVGQPEVYATLSLGLMGGGLIAHRPNLTRAGGRLAASIVLTAAEFEAIKRLSGRARPDSGLGAFHFDPFSSGESFPSGHVSVAFTLAASLADEYTGRGRRLASIPSRPEPPSPGSTTIGTGSVTRLLELPSVLRLPN